MILAQMWGGYSYSWGETADEYPSLRSALEDWADRRRTQRTPDGLYCPTWGDVPWPEPGERTTVGLAWYPCPHRDHDPNECNLVESYPDAILTLGPRGGLRWEWV